MNRCKNKSQERTQFKLCDFMCKWNQLTCYFRHNWSLKFVEVRDFQPYIDCQEWELVRSCQLMSTILFRKVCKKDLIEFMVVVSSVILFFFF